jgi:small-conductance mechanosensitive channel
LSNITASALIFFFFPYRIGDPIEVVDGDHTVAGQIIDMTLFWVKIEDAQGGVTCYPNNLILQKPVKRKP